HVTTRDAQPGKQPSPMSQLQPSRIPQHTSSDIQRTAKQSTDASQINIILLALGAPTISSDDFNRLYQGPFGELLLFMSTQIKGRRQVAKDRHLIQQLVTMLLSELPEPVQLRLYWATLRIRESHSRLPARLPSNNPVRQSMAKLSNIQRETKMLNEHLREKQAELEQAQSQVEYLKRVLQEKRRVVLLLSVLEGRERVRISRFQELTKMMNTTRIPSVEASSVIKDPDAVIEAVKEILWRVKKHSSYLATVDALHLSTPPEEEVLIAKYYENVESVEKRAQILLTRKLDKAVLGETLVEDIDTLMKDTRSLVG
ncbi:hypothetical protein E4T56_gene2119, partial [Termitomyces sp. T112]